MKIKNKILVFFYLILIVNFTIKDLYAENPIYKLSAIKVSYKDNNQIIIAEGKAYATDQFGKEIFSDFIIYDKSKNIIRTKNNSKYKDTKGNKIDADSFFYDLNINKIIAKNKVRYEEIKGNIFYFTEFEYFENSGKGFGKNVKSLMTDKSSFESEYLEIDNNLGTLVIQSDQKKLGFFGKIKSLFSKDNKYTTCENIKNSSNIKDQCPDWSLSTFQTKHDSNKKMIYHDHAIIKIRNVPVFYTPYFSHPDPSVKRKSGLLPASTKNFTDLGRSFKTPYFWAINESSDLTFTPIFYTDENFIYLSEYRKQNKNSSIIIDNSFSSGYKDLNKKGDNGSTLNRTGGSRNHLFLNFNGQYNNNLLFGNNDINIQIQRISQKNYLNVNQINTDLIKQDQSQLLNKFNINSYKNNERLNINASIYENLSQDNPNTKYHYKIPYIEYNNYFSKFNNNISLSSLIEANNSQGDTKQIIQRNTIKVESEPKIIKRVGIQNIIKINGSNLNFYNDNVTNAKENLNEDLYTTLGLETSLPLIRMNKNTEETITPKIFVKHTTGSMINASGNNKILNYSDVYSMDRLNRIDNPETGNSIGYGFDYEINKKNSENKNIIKSKFSLGQVLTDVNKSKMPIKSSLNEKSSNVVGNFNFSAEEIFFKNKREVSFVKIKNKENVLSGFNFDYNFNISNDLNKILKNDINMTYKDGKNELIARYYETHDIGNEQYIDGKIQRSFENNLNLLLGTRKNLESKYTESNFIEANYESDCLKIGINLAKKFYENEDIKKSNNLTLFVAFKPFGQPIAPDLTGLINN